MIAANLGTRSLPEVVELAEYTNPQRHRARRSTVAGGGPSRTGSDVVSREGDGRALG